jgi:hypothetical protein
MNIICNIITYNITNMMQEMSMYDVKYNYITLFLRVTRGNLNLLNQLFEIYKNNIIIQKTLELCECNISAPFVLDRYITELINSLSTISYQYIVMVYENLSETISEIVNI